MHYRLPRPYHIGIRLNEHEREALTTWANSLGLDRSELIRQILHRAFQGEEPRTLLPADLQAALSVPGLDVQP